METTDRNGDVGPPPGAALRAALPATFPVFLGYTTIGAAFGLLLAS